MEKLYVIRNRNERKKEKINNPEKGKGKEKGITWSAEEGSALKKD